MGATDVGTGIALVRLNRTGADSRGDRWNQRMRQRVLARRMPAEGEQGTRTLSG